jgi:hypothetical protein
MKCEYFLLCENEAEGTVANPVLGPVPCCKRCADKVEATLAPFVRYVVIENTPGYLPEDDDPLVTDDYSVAVEYLNERAASYADDPDRNYEVTWGCASSANLAAVMIKDLDREHDLGRWIAIELDEGDDA